MRGNKGKINPKMIRELTQEEVMSVSGVKREYLSGIENGKKFRLTPIQMQLLMEVYGCSSLEEFIQLFYGEEGINEVEVRRSMLNMLKNQKSKDEQEA